MVKLCSGCKTEKDETEFSFSQLKRENRRRCCVCVKNDRASYVKKNTEKTSAIRREWHQKNKKSKNLASRIWAKNNKDRRNAQLKEKRKNDPFFRLRELTSCYVREALKNNGGSKRGRSFLNYLPYDINELKTHLESLFEPWMTWGNQGVYCVDTWNDNDQFTWTWHIDHIIPKSKLPHASMEDDNFKKCWALENLRPLSAKQNVLKSDKMEVI